MNPILIPHPVLQPDGADYAEGLKFEMSLNGKPQHTLDGKILVPVRFELISRFVRELINRKKAQMTVLVKCPRTYERMSFDVDDTKRELKLPLAHYADKIILSSYVSATESIEHFSSNEHHDEFSDINIDLPAGAILAQGSDIELTIDSLPTLSAAIRLMTGNKLEDGQYDVNVEDDYIEISMNKATRQNIENLRRYDPNVLYPSIYMMALTHAIQNVTPDRTRKWEESLRKTLEKNNIRIDEEDLKSRAYVYAQKLLQYPVTRIMRQEGDIQ